MKKILIILLSLISFTLSSQVNSPDSLSVGGGLSLDSLYIDSNDSLVFRFTDGNLYDIARYTTGGGAPPEPPPARYHVSTSGSDVTGNGSEAFPWETLAYAGSQATSPGDTIAPKKGDTFSITSVLTITNGGLGGIPIVWNGGLWGTGVNAIVQKSQNVAAGIRIAACKNVVIENITLDGQNYNGDGFVIGGWQPVYGIIDQDSEDSITIQDCKIINIGTDGWQSAILIRPVSNDISYTIIQRDSIDGSTNHGIALYPQRVAQGGGISGSGNFKPYLGYNVITNCGKLDNGVASGILCSMEADSAIIEHNVITQGADGNAPGIALGLDPLDNSHVVTGAKIRYNDIRMDGGYALLIQQGENPTMDIYYNKLSSYNQSNGRTVYIQSADYTGCDINFYNNVIISEGDNGATVSIYATASGTINFQNNSLVNEGSGASGYRCLDGTNAGTYTSSYNNYYRQLAGSTVDMVRDGATIYTRADLASWEATAVEGDPAFHTEFTNLHPNTGSVLIDAGVDVGLLLDFEGTAVTDPPYIGIYESTED